MLRIVSPAKSRSFLSPALLVGCSFLSAIVTGAQQPTVSLEQGKFTLHKLGQPIGEETYEIRRETGGNPGSNDRSRSRDESREGLRNRREGKRADLILNSGDPLADIHNTRNVEYVVTNGTLYHTAELWQVVGFKP